MRLIRIEFENGARADVPDNVSELDMVNTVDGNGNAGQELWGSLIARTNGEALELFLLNL